MREIHTFESLSLVAYARDGLTSVGPNNDQRPGRPDRQLAFKMLFRGSRACLIRNVSNAFGG